MDVKTAGRTLELFELFAREGRALTLTEVSQLLRIPLSSCHNLLKAVQTRGYVYSVAGDRRQIYPTRKMLELSARIGRSEPWVAQVEERLRALRDSSGETVIFGRRQGDKAVYLLVVESEKSIRFTAEIGSLRPLHATGLGKALLMQLGAEEREKTVSKLELAPFNDNTITKAQVLLGNLAQYSALGYAVSIGEYAQDAITVAIPLEIMGGVYAVGITGPAVRMRENIGQAATSLWTVGWGEFE